MADVIGTSGSLVLLSRENNGVVIDTQFNLVVETGDVRTLGASRDWEFSQDEVSGSVHDLADGALTSLDINVITASGRMYTIPKGVQDEAKKALEWRKEYKRGGTPVGLNTARTLAKGGQIGIEKVRHIAKYFPRHEVDKKAKGWDREDDKFPSNGRIAWALWGGDAAWRWAQNIVDRENKKAVRADGYSPWSDETNNGYGADIDAFKQAYELDETAAPEFIARVRLDGSGIDRLYKVDLDGLVYVWDGDCWEDLGHVDHDVYTYDRALDDPYDKVPKDHFVIDAGSAIIISARLQQKPFACVSIMDIDADEAQLTADAVSEVDWDVVDYAITAAGDAFTDPEAPATDEGYTSEERAENARRQVRDATGKFAAQGSRVIVGGDQNKVGAITRINPDDQTVTVQYDDGTSEDVLASDTQRVESYVANYIAPAEEIAPIDTSGILGEPRTPIDRPNARIPGTLPALTSEDLQRVINDWPAWVNDQRAAYEANPAKAYKAPAKKTAEDSRIKDDKSRAPERANPLADRVTDAYDHPLLQDWLTRTGSRGGVSSPNSTWYQPVISSGEKEQALTPETSDVQPLYFAIVSPDDPRAVLDLVSMIPASSTSNAPAAYKRSKGEWVHDDGILSDLKSATPPPVVPLDSATLDMVLRQVDGIDPIAASGMAVDHILMVLWGPNPRILNRAPGEYDDVFLGDTDEEYDEEDYDDFDGMFSILAAGGADRNRGNAERLRRYWTRGKGAAKIRWGTPGDWKRCVRYLSKYMGPRAKGYCQLRHMEATGVSTGSRLNPGRRNFAIAVPGENDDDLSTHVTHADMALPLTEINNEHDDLFDAHWEMPEQIAKVLEAIADLEEDDYALIAAGGLDRNRGNAEKLRRYWTVGKGGAKIRWNTGGDWTRCVRYLSKYMGPRAKGYCALRHKEMTGLWTGDKKHAQLYGRKKGRNMFSTDFIVTSEEMNDRSALRARMEEARERVSMTADGSAAHGAKFYIPLVIPEDLESGDGRKFAKEAIDIRDLPLPLLWQIKTADGHMGSVVVGRIDHMERTEEGIGNAYGVFDTGAYGKEAERLVRNGFIRGVSADMDKFEAEEVVAEVEDEDGEKIEKQKLHISQARVMAVTIVPKPAFQECKILIVDDEDENEEENVIPDGVYVEDVDPIEAAALVASGLIAGAIPVTPPADWFVDQKLKKATPLTVTDEGQVFGHIAAWHVDHIGMAFGTKPPRSRSKYAYFHTGVVRTDNGKDVPVGQLTLAGGHASLEASAVEAARHYDDTASAIADVHAGEDAYGIWVAGALRPGATPEQVRALRASAPSGDWRPIKGGLELVAVCQVNVPGFPIARARVASGQVMALVAAGANALARMKSDPVAELSDRISRMEKKEFAAATEEARARFNAIKAELPVVESVTAGGVYEVNEDTYEERAELAPKLKKLLSGVYSLATRAQGYHWNVKGADFAQYHALFGEIYGDVHGSIDPLAENILKLDVDSPFNLSEFSATSAIGDSTINTATPQGMAYDLYSANEVIIAELKDAFKTADEADEQGIADFIAGRIDMHQKWRWQLRASVTPEELQVLENQANESVVNEYYEQVFSAITAGGSTAELKQLEEAQLSIKAAAAKAKIDEVRSARKAELAARAEELSAKVFADVEFEDGFGYIPMRTRKKLAKEGKALPDGSYPITNIDSLKDSIQAYGRGKKSKRAAIRRHIIKRARQLKRADLIPEEWKGLSSPSKKVQEFTNKRIEEMEAAAEAEALGKA